VPKVVSAGLVVYRWSGDLPGLGLEVLLVHPGGPYYAKKDAGAWSIPKGEVDPGEDLLAAARRECREETGYEPDGPFVSLGGVKYRNHKQVFAWAVEGDFDPAALVSSTFELEWPPRSGRSLSVPEVDRAAWFDLVAAREAILPAQRRFIDDLPAVVGAATGGEEPAGGDAAANGEHPAGGDAATEQEAAAEGG
jgi:predicted NUDIX family NTP pyrophosphohydrolase